MTDTIDDRQTDGRCGSVDRHTDTHSAVRVRPAGRRGDRNAGWTRRLDTVDTPGRPGHGQGGGSWADARTDGHTALPGADGLSLEPGLAGLSVLPASILGDRRARGHLSPRAHRRVPRSAGQAASGTQQRGVDRHTDKSKDVHERGLDRQTHVTHRYIDRSTINRQILCNLLCLWFFLPNFRLPSLGCREPHLICLQHSRKTNKTLIHGE